VRTQGNAHLIAPPAQRKRRSRGGGAGPGSRRHPQHGRDRQWRGRRPYEAARDKPEEEEAAVAAANHRPALLWWEGAEESLFRVYSNPRVCIGSATGICRVAA
jgi:hypothetical protein